MLSQNELLTLLSTEESDRIEFTISTKDTDKFCQAICAFSNDFPNNKQNGYLIININDKGQIGVDEKGKPTNIVISDELLQYLAGLRESGNILPKPALSVNKYTINGNDIAIVEVYPCLTPPVRYKGTIWIRNGPRKAIAGEVEERILLEKRTSNAKTYDAIPCFGSSIEDINISLFKSSYLPYAIDAETLEKNGRDIKSQLASLRLFDLKSDCPSNAGIILLCDVSKYYFSGNYIQYVKFSGESLDSEIINAQEFKADLISIMNQLDSFVKNNIETRPVFVSMLKEENIKTYPFKAIREILNNAVMHRDYESNAPIKFYEFSDRIEISNPGGLYGSATPSNFPNQSDYRNPILAEGLKILGYINKFNRGVETAKSELKQNGNPEPQFIYDIPSQFAVIVYKKMSK
jgi:ATP-dependent DNA helicase RecG